MNNKFYEAIDNIEANLKLDLIGPIKEDEVLARDMPLDHYVSGILWPQRSSQVIVTENGEFPVAEEITQDDEVEDTTSLISDSITASNVYKPSAMAITVMLKKSTENISISFKYGKYSHKEIEQEVINKNNDDGAQTKIITVSHFTRSQYSENFILSIRNSIGICDIKEYDDFIVRCQIRKILDNGDKLVTVSVVNARASKQKNIELNTSSLFQCVLMLSTDDEFIPLYNDGINYSDEEDLINNMLYSNVFNYAYGHGCSIHYDDSCNLVKSIHSAFIPSSEVLQMMPGTLKNENILKMNLYDSISSDVAISFLNEFVNEYSNWYKEQRDIASKMETHSVAVKVSLERIKLCIDRISLGVEMLKNELVYDAFCLMNKSMLLQRVKSKQGIKEDDVKWYPFQLAYILQIIPDIVSEDSKFRESVDLLWFPTGGGKTEAYLGVAAFTIFHRRLVHRPDDDGVAILMRYTLRLLTIQQFERATALICACEHLRKQHKLCGGEINIGLWIGSNMTPNSLDKAKETVEKLREYPHEKIYEGNPIQITNCPWCKSEIDIGCYTFENTMQIKCPNHSCDFHNSLPIYIIDEDVYNIRPTLILSTVDKFARIVWEPKSKKLFGDKHELPIELIIQDELHLISGPLGSIAGIYELAVSRLCERNGKKAKVIASTATVRNAKAQVKNLYNMDSIQFPPNGISADDSFFAIRANRSNKPARRYIGLCETGGSVADLLIRIYANLMYTKLVFIKLGIDEKIIDQYYTTVGYYNAIKDLGASSSIISDRVKVTLKSLIEHKFKDYCATINLTVKDIPKYYKSEELTSRKTSKEIKDTLKDLEIKYPNELCFDYILASNMLSVGIDINRLGTMTVYNQPKSNAEYIQATSRVGRSNPGLVLSMYNAMRSRDKSHYEQFPFYHKTMYQYVEATSVTPFSARAMEKALHCSFTALVRHLVPNMNTNESASKFRRNIPEVIEIQKYIISVIESINAEAVKDAEYFLDEFAEIWEELAKNNANNFTYTDWNGGASLLRPAEKENDLGVPSTLNALRNVEDSSNVYILRRD